MIDTYNEDIESLKAYIDILEKANNNLSRKLKKIYKICLFKNGKDYKSAEEQLIDIEELLGV